VTSRPPACRSLAAVVALLAALALAAGACGATSDAGQEDPATVRVFASSVLTGAFTDLGETFTAKQPGVEVIFNFAGAGDLITQVRQGAPADVLAVADASFMDEANDLVDAPTAFVRNRLAIAVAPGNPLEITSLSDLSRSGLKVILGSKETSVGKQSQQALGRAGVTVEPVSLEVTVKGVVTKVALGEADAGIVYATDVLAADGAVDGVTIPEAQNVIAVYPIATLVASRRNENAQAFVDLVLSPEGQQVLTDHGFLPAP
jgi:molybdate transport system substrate-binding protein